MVYEKYYGLKSILAWSVSAAETFRSIILENRARLVEPRLSGSDILRNQIKGGKDERKNQ